ncbi:TniB family NTP-binding protein, partial [Roseobacter sp. HKCCD6547]|uniref:TniB family NTP-binding protein n=2 Tax=Roseobacter TaxID=2433 RepID=UPI00345FD10F
MAGPRADPPVPGRVLGQRDPWPSLRSRRTYREQRIVLNTLRFLSNRLQISLVCFGVNHAREAIGRDVQLARRFEQFTLSRWAATRTSSGCAALGTSRFNWRRTVLSLMGIPDRC